MENSENMRERFERYAANECTPEEIRVLLTHFDVLEDGPILRRLIGQYLDYEAAENVETEHAIQDVHSKLMGEIRVQTQPVSRKIFHLPQWSRAAAIWTGLLVSAGIAIYIYSGRSSGLSLNSQSLFENLHTITTVTGEKRRVALSDGSVIWLNAKSILTFPDSFRSDKREVTLEGEAYFEIFRDVNKPFTVRSGKVLTKVLGTSFDIKAYTEDSTVSVAVLTGRVQVNSDRSEIRIIPDQQVSYSAVSGEMSRKNVDASNEIAWKNGKMQFRNIRLSQVIKTLRRNYADELEYNPRLGNYMVHADFDSEMPVGKVLELISVSLGGKVTKTGARKYYLDGDIKNL